MSRQISKTENAMSKSSRVKRMEEDELCVVCFRHADIYSIGGCDHPVCYECSTRMRVLCGRTECPICRKNMDIVVFTKKVSPYISIYFRNMQHERRYSIYFESDFVMRAYDQLLEHICPICKPMLRFPDFIKLKDHVRKSHERFYCELCNEHLRIFTQERRCYTRVQLAHHRRKGDEDDKSHKGHPLCEFCDERFMDKDDLFVHLRRDHFFCHFCEADGIQQYYKDYAMLQDHFKQDHFLCEEGECIDLRFTSVYRTKLDLQAHRMQTHVQSANKSEARQARTVDIAFTVNHRQGHYPDRGRGARGGRGGRRDHNDIEEQAAAAAMVPPSVEFSRQQQQKQRAVDINCVQNFPSLGGGAPVGGGAGDDSSSGNKSIAQKLAHHNRFTVRAGGGSGRGALNDEDFPTLGAASVTMTSGGNRVMATPTTTSLRFSLNAKKPPNHSNSNAKNDTATNVSIKYNCSGGSQSAEPLPQPQNQKVKPHVGTISHSGNITFKPNPGIPMKRINEEEFPSLVPASMVSNQVSWVVPPPKQPPPPAAAASPPQQKKPSKKMNNEKGNKKGNKQESEVDSFAKDFPSLVPSSQSQKQMLNYSGLSAITIPVKSAPVPNSGSGKSVSVPNNSSSGLASNSVDEVSNTKSKKKKKGINKTNNNTDNIKPISNTDNMKSDLSVSSQSINNNLPNKPKKKILALNSIFFEPNTEEGPQEDFSWGRLGDYESYNPSAGSNVQTIKADLGSEGQKKTSELQIGNLKTPKLKSDEFPSLLVNKGKNVSLKNTAWGPPQSKTKKRSSPPSAGLSNKSRNGAPEFSDTDMTFTTSSGQTFAISSTSESPPPPVKELWSPNMPEFSLPPNFELRNSALINTIQEVCQRNMEKFDKFKRLAGLLRSGELTGQEYYKQCKQIMGKVIFHCVLPELLSLLPDIQIQQAVLEAYKKIDGAKGCTTSFVVCAQCQQVLIPDDFSHHVASHDLQFYPPLRPTNRKGL